MTKISGENDVNNSWAEKPAELYLRGMNKLLNKRQRLIENNLKYAIHDTTQNIIDVYIFFLSIATD